MKRVLLSLLVAGLNLLCPRDFASSQDFPPALVVTEPVKTLDFHKQLTLIGRSKARAESRIVSEVSGRVVRIGAREGVWISKGKPLVTIDAQRIQFTLDAKTAEAAQAEADADLAKKELARAENLFEQEILPERTLDAARAAATRTIERYHQLEAERNQLTVDVANCTIRAPYGGFTIRELIQVGEWVNPGTPVYEIVDLSVVKVTLDLPERHFGHVSIGSLVSIMVSGNDQTRLVGKITGIAPQASPTTHTFPVIVSVQNGDGRLGSGMLVKATVSLKGKFTSLAVSKDAIIRQGDQTLVYTIVEGKAAPIQVRLSSSNGSMVAVEGEGLTDGMPVVVRGNERIFPGSPVQTPDGGRDSGEDPEGDAATQTSG
ncbi:MAG: efflux RND transporter periplasmic adaptor subunit [Candidatus Krumholzibacteria bacterium]|nr:efflux RND transporter periplasmic adaptor subunit [Candidatus Krumholzibacteria bacterium]